MQPQQALTREQTQSFYAVIRLLLGVIVIGLAIFQLFLTFRGLDQPAAMDQAQIARQIARGEGFTTKFIRPVDVADQDKQKNKAPIDFNAFKDTNSAPLYPYILSTAIKISGYDQFESHRMDAEISNVYGGDRVIASVSTLFFIISLILAYFLCTDLFDELIACTTVAFMGLSELMLGYAISGLPQPFMMCCLLGALLCIKQAVYHDKQFNQGWSSMYSCLAFLLIAAICLSSYIGIWCAVGLVVFCGLKMKPKGLHAAYGAAILAFLVLLPILTATKECGGMTNRFLHAVYFGFGGDAGTLMQRSTAEASVSFNNSNFFLRLLGYTFAQFNTLYTNMGSIVVTPFFLLSLFNRFKSDTVEGVKWATFSMWICACVGMALFGETAPISESQLSILFAPVFAAYGLAMVFNLLARLNLGANFKVVRGICIFFMLLISSGLFLFQLPRQLYLGIWTSARGLPHYPPYYPPKFNFNLHEMTNPDDLIVTDQPWAVAWYADRKALWIPRSIDEFTEVMEPIFGRGKQSVQGFLITPSSHAMTASGMAGIIREYGDFAPLVMEGKLLQLAPKHNVAFADFFTVNANEQDTSRTLGSLVSSHGQYPYRNFLLGADMVYYSRTPVLNPDTKPKRAK